MPSENTSTSFTNYLNTFGALEGFIDSQQCDCAVIAGDFNADFDCGGPLVRLLNGFVSDMESVFCDFVLS